MATTRAELIEWAATLDNDDSIGVDEGGLCLRSVKNPEGVWFEIGGLPEEGAAPAPVSTSPHTPDIFEVFRRADWEQLRKQKLHIVRLADGSLDSLSMNQDLLEGLINFLDYVQDAAELHGYPVKFLSEEEEAEEAKDAAPVS